MTTTTAFQVGDTVRAKVKAQLLTPGATYRVAAVHNQPFGVVVYVLEAQDGSRRAVANGHLLLDPA